MHKFSNVNTGSKQFEEELWQWNLKKKMQITYNGVTKSYLPLVRPRVYMWE